MLLLNALSFVAMCREISGAAVHKKAPDGSDSPALAVLKRWIRELRKEYSPLPPGTSAIIFRLLFPEEDKRRVYNMRETLLARRLSDLLCLTDGRLQSWNNSSSSGCLGQEVYDAIERTWTVRIYPSALHLQLSQCLARMQITALALCILTK